MNESIRNSNTLKRKYEDYLSANNWKKVRINEDVRKESEQKQCDFIDLVEEEDEDSNAEIIFDQAPKSSLNEEDPLALTDKDMNLLETERSKSLPGKGKEKSLRYFRKNNGREENIRTRMNSIELCHDLFNNIQNEVVSNSSNKCTVSPISQRISPNQFALTVNSNTSATTQNLIGDENFIEIKEEQNPFNQVTDLEMILPPKFEPEEDDIDCVINSRLNKEQLFNGSANMTLNAGQGFVIEHVKEPFIVQHENDDDSSFCPKIDNIYTTNKESFESDFSNDDDCFLINERELTSNGVETIPVEQSSQNHFDYYSTCHVCSVSFNSEADWLTHIQSFEHNKSFVSFKENLGIPSSLEKETLSKKTKTKSKKGDLEGCLQLGNKADSLDPVSYIPLNLLKRRIIICGTTNSPTKKTSANNLVLDNDISNTNKSSKKPLSDSSSTSNESGIPESDNSELPIIFIPYQVRVKSTPASKPKLILMYLPHFDKKTSHSFMKESWSLPSDAWIGDVVGPVQENFNVSFNIKQKKPNQEISVSRVLAPVNLQPSSIPLALNEVGPDAPIPLSRGAESSPIKCSQDVSWKDQDKVSSDTDTAEETEESFMNKLGLQSVSTLTKNSSNEETMNESSPETPIEDKERTIHMKAWVTKESSIKFSVVDTQPQSLLEKSSPAKTNLDENVSQSSKDKFSVDRNEFKKYLTRGTLLVNSNAANVTNEAPLKEPNGNETEKVHLSLNSDDDDGKEKDGSKEKAKVVSSINPEVKKSKSETLNISIKILKEEGVDIKESFDRLTLCTESKKDPEEGSSFNSLECVTNIGKEKGKENCINSSEHLEVSSFNGQECTADNREVKGEKTKININEHFEENSSCNNPECSADIEGGKSEENSINLNEHVEEDSYNGVGCTADIEDVEISEENSVNLNEQFEDHSYNSPECTTDIGEVEKSEENSINLNEPVDIEMTSSPSNEMNDYIRLLNEDVEVASISSQNKETEDHRHQTTLELDKEFSTMKEQSDTNSRSSAQSDLSNLNVDDSKDPPSLMETLPRNHNLAFQEERINKRMKKKSTSNEKELLRKFFLEKEPVSQYHDSSSISNSVVSQEENLKIESNVLSDSVEHESNPEIENESENSATLSDLETTSDINEERNNAYSKLLIGFF